MYERSTSCTSSNDFYLPFNLLPSFAHNEGWRVPDSLFVRVSFWRSQGISERWTREHVTKIESIKRTASISLWCASCRHPVVDHLPESVRWTRNPHTAFLNANSSQLRNGDSWRALADDLDRIAFGGIVECDDLLWWRTRVICGQWIINFASWLFCPEMVDWLTGRKTPS